MIAEEVSSLDHWGGSPCDDQSPAERVCAYREAARYWIKSDVHLMNKVGRLADTHQRRARVDVLHPAVNLLVGAEGKVEQFILDLQLYTEWFDVDALNVNNIDKLEHEGWRR